MKYILVIILMMFSSYAEAQEIMCLETDKLFSGLTGAYKEKQNWAGITNNGNIVTLFLNEKTEKEDDKSFTLVYSMPNGVSCIMYQGSNWSIGK